MLARLMIAVIASTLGVSVAGSARGDEADALKRAVALFEAQQWKVTKVVPGADGVSGSILVVRDKGDGFSTESMWLGLGGDTPFTLNGRSEGVRVADIQEGMSVTFQYAGLAKSLPPHAVGVTGVAVSGTGTPGSGRLRELLRQRNHEIMKPK